MVQYKIEFDANTCIGSLNCLTTAGELFGEDENKFTILKNAKLNEATEKWELMVGEDLLAKAKKAEENCPSLAITISEA